MPKATNINCAKPKPGHALFGFTCNWIRHHTHYATQAYTRSLYAILISIIMNRIIIVLSLLISNLVNGQNQIDSSKCFKDEYSNHSIIYSGLGKYDIYVKIKASSERIIEKWGDCYYSNILYIKIYREETLIYETTLRKSDFKEYFGPGWNVDDFLFTHPSIRLFVSFPFKIQISIGIYIPDTDVGHSFLLEIYEDDNSNFKDKIFVQPVND